MSKSLRLSLSEQEQLMKKFIEINNILIQKGFMPLRFSELAHKILEISIPCIKANAQGEIFLELRDPESAANCTKVGV